MSVHCRRLVVSIAFLQRTPAPITGLEDLQSDLPPMLDDSVLAVATTVAASIAFVDVISSVDKRIPQAFRVGLCLRIRKLFLAFGID